MSKHAPFNLCLTLGLLATACGSRETEVRRYKEINFQSATPATPSAPMAGNSGDGMANRKVPTAALRVAWDLPQGWAEAQGSSMRLATFVVDGAECAVTAFPGDTGGLEANLRRWLGQLSAEGSDEQIAGLTQRATAFTTKGGWKGQAFDVTAALPDGAAKGMRAAIIAVDGKSLFVKLVGPADVLEKQKGAFEALCQSMRPAEGEAAPAPTAPEMPAAARPAAGPMAGAMGGQMTGNVPTAGLQLAWQTPAGWTEKAGSSMRLATFGVDGAECTVTAFPGDTGGEAANLRRWLGQLKVDPTPEMLAKLSSAAVAFKTEGGWDGKLFDLASALPEGAASGMRAAIIPVEGQTVFVKLSGPPAVLGQQAAALTTFCQSLRLKK